MKLPELKSLLVQHNVKGYMHLKKPQLIALSLTKGILTRDYPEKEALARQQKKQHLKEHQKEYQKGYWEEYQKERKLKRNFREGAYDRTRYIRNQPRPVEILDLETGDVVAYPSIYKAAKAHGQNAPIIQAYNGKVWRTRYEIKVCDRINELTD